MALHYTTLTYITFRSHYITLHYITLHYIALHHSTLQYVQPYKLTHAHTHTHTIYLSLSLSHSLTHSLTHALTHARTHTRTHALTRGGSFRESHRAFIPTTSEFSGIQMQATQDIRVWKQTDGEGGAALHQAVISAKLKAWCGVSWRHHSCQHSILAESSAITAFWVLEQWWAARGAVVRARSPEWSQSCQVSVAVSSLQNVNDSQSSHYQPV